MTKLNNDNLITIIDRSGKYEILKEYLLNNSYYFNSFNHINDTDINKTKPKLDIHTRK